MSELKVIDLGNIRESIEKDEPVYYEYYAKSEADKVIARHKYKRCLDQVENCRASSVYFFRISEGEKDEGKAAEYRRVSDWFDKWEERWLELAEVFKTIGDN